MSSAAVDTERRNKIASARQLFAAGQGAAETTRAQTDPEERKRHARTAFNNLHESMTHYAELIESGITFDTVGTRDIPENVTKALALAQEMCDVMTGAAAAAAAPDESSGAAAAAPAPAESGASAAAAAPAPAPAESGTAAAAAAAPAPAESGASAAATDKVFEKLLSEMPAPPKAFPMPVPAPSGGVLKRKFHELVRRKYENIITGEPFVVFYAFMQQLLYFTLDPTSLIHNTLTDGLNKFQKIVDLYIEWRTDARYNEAQKMMFSILDYIEKNYSSLKRRNGKEIKESDLLKIFMDVVSGGATDVERRLKKEQYGTWAQSGGKRKTNRRHRHKRRTTRRR